MARRRQEVEIRGTDKSKAAFASLANSARKTKAVFTGLGGAVKGAFLPLVGAAGAISLIRRTSAAMNELDLIAKRARTAGFGTDFFQGLGLAAEEANVSQGLLNSSLLAFVKRVGEAKAGIGPLVTGLKSNNLALLESLRNTRNQQEAFFKLSDAIRNASTATEKAQIANAAFGRSGIEMVRILDLGSQGLIDTADKAKRLGLVYDKDLLAKQEKLNNDLGVFNKVIGVQFKSILVQLAPVITALAQKTAGWARELRSLFDLAGGAGMTKIDSLKTRINELNTALDSGEFQAGAARNRLVAELESKTAELKSVTNAMRQIAQSSNATAKTDFGGGGAALGGGSLPAIAPVRAAKSVTAATKPLKLFQTTMRETRDEASLLEQGFTTGMSSIENAINDLVTNGKVNFKSLITSMLGDFARLASSNLFKSLGSSLLGGGGLFGSGGGASSALAGGLRFGGLFAKGGDIKGGEVGIVGEKGPEFVQGPARITPMGAGGPGGGTVVNVTVNAPGATAATLAAIQGELNDLKRSLPAIIDGRNAQTRRYAPGRA